VAFQLSIPTASSSAVTVTLANSDGSYGAPKVIASFASYALEKKMSRTPERFGKGAIEGVAGPEAANNAAAGGAFIPLMTLGIPPNVVMALLLGAFIIHGLQPGPLLMVQKPELFWGIVASMYIGNVMLLVLNMPLIGMWVQVLKVPYSILFPLILMFCIVGVFASGNAVFDVFVMVVFGVLGYLMRKFGYEPAPLVLAFVLGPMLENNLRKSLILSHGDFTIFVERPMTCCLARAACLTAPMARAESVRSLFAYLHASPSPYHAVANAVARLEEFLGKALAQSSKLRPTRKASGH
jgi:putative tricarboxylic transport membrane protein